MPHADDTMTSGPTKAEATAMESSRIFVKNLPRNITEAQFRQHFAADGRDVTDVKLMADRRIGFVGYKTAEDAALAVRYFNRSYIRMSKIAVEAARPVTYASKNSNTSSHVATTEVKTTTKVAAKDDQSLKKRKREELDESDPKLKEFLALYTNKRLREGELVSSAQDEAGVDEMAPVPDAGESDDEYEDIRAQPAKPAVQERPPPEQAHTIEKVEESAPQPDDDTAQQRMPQVQVDATDDDWLRSRTNRLLDLVDPEDAARPNPQPQPQPLPGPPATRESADEEQPETAQEQAPDGSTSPKPTHGREQKAALDSIRKTKRLYVRNLAYTTTQEEMEENFRRFGPLEEVLLPVNGQGVRKGFAMITFEDAESAVAAYEQTDGSVFHGRMIHVLPAMKSTKKDLDEFELAKLPLKKQNLIRKKAAAATNTFNWNSLFMSQDAVNTSVAERMGISKSELLDPTDSSAAVTQAVAETQVIHETKAYFAAHGVDLDAFRTQKRGDTSILVKNFKFGTSLEELRKMFEECGTVLQVLMPPSGTMAIVQYAQPANAKASLSRLAYRRVGDSILFLEAGPKGLFRDSVAVPPPLSGEGPRDAPAKLSAAELLERDDDGAPAETSSLFVKGLSFSTTTAGLAEAFGPLDGFVSASVKTKTDPKKPGQVLSMGFGFLEFRTKEQAQAALKVVDGHGLDGHTLSCKASHKGLDAAAERRREDVARKKAGQRTKLIIKNLSFEVSKKDVRALFGAYGQLRAVRIPKKFNHGSRGFAFAEFVTPREAESAYAALRDTHFLGRKLVLEFAESEADAADPEEEIARMQRKIKGQAHRVALQRLTGAGRKKVDMEGGEDGEMA